MASGHDNGGGAVAALLPAQARDVVLLPATGVRIGAARTIPYGSRVLAYASTEGRFAKSVVRGVEYTDTRGCRVTASLSPDEKGWTSDGACRSATPTAR